MRKRLLVLVAGGGLAWAGTAAAQDVNIYNDPNAVNKSSSASSGAGAAMRGSSQAQADKKWDISFDEEEDEGEGGDDAPGEHTVRRGDTLWQISQSQYGNPWEWPRLWSYNPTITNPHWIYPGDKLRLQPAGLNTPAPPPPSKVSRKLTGHAWEQKLRSERAGLTGGQGVMLRTTSFITTGEEKDSGRVVGSKEEKLLLTKPDELYIEFTNEQPLKAGESYSVFRTSHDVFHPSNPRVPFGHAIQIVGEVRVDQITKGNIARATIMDAPIAIERGDRVRPRERRQRVIDPKTNAKKIDGLIMAMVNHTTSLASDESLVYIDKGKKDGVVLGNRFLVLRHGDGYKPLLELKVTQDERYPAERVAEILVVDLREETCIGLVRTLRKELQIGDRVTMLPGY